MCGLENGIENLWFLLGAVIDRNFDRYIPVCIYFDSFRNSVELLIPVFVYFDRFRNSAELVMC